MTAESLGWELRSALPPLRLHSVSLYNTDADVLWLSEGALGPDEHTVVIESIETQAADKTLPYHEYGMEDGRIGLFLPVRAPRGDLVGTVMILADMKSLNEGTMQRILTPQVRTILQKMAVLLRKANPQATGDTSQVIAMPGAVGAAAMTAASVTGATAPGLKALGRTAETLAPAQIDQMLSLELVPEAPPVEKPKVNGSAAAPPARNGAGAAPRAAPAPSKPAPSRTSPAAAPASAAPAKAAPPARPAAAANTSPAPPPAAPREIEVLAFDPDIQFPVARAANPAPAPEIEVLAFELDPHIPAARSVAAPAATVAPAPVAPPVAPVQPKRPVASVQAPAPAAPPAAPAPAASARAPAKNGALTNTSTSTTMAVPASNVPDLINDTGQQVALDETTTIEPAPELPPLEPLSAEETATDLTLHVQELVKLRSSGRTRRYEVLARSQRDISRNEVPAAFVADSARGREGAALDALVVERLLQWLGKHGEVIWDSEPASFSVNLSIGALEDPTFPQKIARWLETTNVPAEYIGFEISEFACVQCRPEVQRFVEACEKLGCFLVIDNFSFDSAVFELLGSKALRHVKIDSKLTIAAMKDKLPQALVVAILQACKVLGVHCVAKRIESQSAMQWLTAVGCDFAQSFLHNKPVALDTLVPGSGIKALRE